MGSVISHVENRKMAIARLDGDGMLPMVVLVLQLVAYAHVEGNNVNKGCGMVNWAATYEMDSEGARPE
jgi:hypothetical protein